MLGFAIIWLNNYLYILNQLYIYTKIKQYHIFV